MDALEQGGQLRLAGRGPRDGAHERRGAREPLADVEREEFELLALGRGGRDPRGSLLLEDLDVRGATRRGAHDRAEQGDLRAEGGVHGLGGGLGVGGDGRDRRAREAVLDEPGSGGVEDALTRPQRSVPPPHGVVRASRLDRIGHFDTVPLSSIQ